MRSESSTFCYEEVDPGPPRKPRALGVRSAALERGSTGRFVFRGVTVIDGTGARPLAQADVAVADGRMVGVWGRGHFIADVLEDPGFHSWLLQHRR